jgi:CubicO group peptidase (beta-lactamase class C family)
LDHFDPVRRELMIGSVPALMLAPAITAAMPISANTTPSAASDFAARLFTTKVSPALSLAVCRAGKVIWSAAFGHVDLERRPQLRIAFRWDPYVRFSRAWQQ